MNEIRELTDELLAFRDERDWAQFHNPKDLALAVSVEAAELLELLASASRISFCRIGRFRRALPSDNLYSS